MLVRLFKLFITLVLLILLTVLMMGLQMCARRCKTLRMSSLATCLGTIVGLILPSPLSGLDEKRWQSENEPTKLQGTMACQLSLPSLIVSPCQQLRPCTKTYGVCHGLDLQGQSAICLVDRHMISGRLLSVPL
ncbi:hypothetical protein EV363DRAFT_134241 [Boletus edulis]|nr:hypothetical protein EV363DRAFT_134241 [Boletus edulis]